MILRAVLTGLAALGALLGGQSLAIHDHASFSWSTAVVFPLVALTVAFAHMLWLRFDRSATTISRSRIRAAALFLLIAGVLPVVGYLVASGHPPYFPWRIPLALGLPALAFVLVSEPGAFVAGDVAAESGVDRLVSFVVAVLFLSGTAAGLFVLWGSWEIRLLAVAPLALMGVFSAAALVHPDPRKGREISQILSRVGFLLFVFSLSVLYFVA